MHRLMLVALFFSLGCTSTIMSATTPHGVDDQHLALGMHRSDVEDILNATTFEIALPMSTLVQYRYEDFEFPRGRTALYASTGPADVVFVLPEWLIQRNSQRFAHGLYGADDELVWFLSTDKDGNNEVYLGGSPEPLEIKRQHSYLDVILGSGHRFGGEDE